jgi:hypothetical protein
MKKQANPVSAGPFRSIEGDPQPLDWIAMFLAGDLFGNVWQKD